MNVIRKIMILCLLAGMLMPVWAKDYQMTMFGIKSDGTTMNTRSIQKAIDFISESGGGASGVYCRTLSDWQYSSEVKCDDPFGRGGRVGRFH